AYWSLKEESWNPRDPFWKKSWKYQGLQRVKFFLWLASKQKLLTNVECVRRGIGQNSTCSVCGKEPEDTLHVLRDCSAAKGIWKHIIPDNQLFRFFFGTLDDWFSINLDCHVKLSIRGHELSHCSYRHTSDSDITLGEMWVHLFIDGVVANDNGHVSAGGVIRYHHGNWILGFTRYLGRCSIFEAELWGI
ncbi:hypothetical protein Goklo_009311, partial [Gossypium klotzschianum]|nr:hypothetical protein [Gossypium klotzschianum]